MNMHFGAVCGVPPLVIESPKPPKCHPEREGGGWGGREGSPHKSWRRSTVIAEILRSPRTHPPLAQDDTNLGLVHRARSFLRSGSAPAMKRLRMTHGWSGLTKATWGPRRGQVESRNSDIRHST